MEKLRSNSEGILVEALKSESHGYCSSKVALHPHAQLLP